MVSRELLNLRNTIKRPVFVLSNTNKSNICKFVKFYKEKKTRIQQSVNEMNFFCLKRISADCRCRFVVFYIIRAQYSFLCQKNDNSDVKQTKMKQTVQKNKRKTEKEEKENDGFDTQWTDIMQRKNP